MSHSHIVTSESVTEGHPDKVCDYIADSILDEHIGQDPHCRVACAVLCKNDQVVIAGEISSTVTVDYDTIVRRAVAAVGYTDPSEPFNAANLKITSILTTQSPAIAQGVQSRVGDAREQGAGDQGIMFGFATDATHALMPLPILLAHRIAHGLAASRKSGQSPWMRRDGKTQVSVLYDGIGRSR